MQAIVAPTAAADRAVERKAVLADRYKTRMCRNYEETGRCPYENKCMFAHGEAELRTTEMNLEDGLVTEEAIKAFQRQQMLKKQALQQPVVAAPQQVQQQQQQQQAEASPSPVKRARTIVRQNDVYAHQPYVAQPTTYGYNYYGSCQCPDCIAAAAYVAPPLPPVEEPCQCAECLAYYKQYGYAAPTIAPSVMEP